VLDVEARSNWIVGNLDDVGEANQVQCESQGIVVHGKMVGRGVCRPRQAADIVVVRVDGVSVVYLINVKSSIFMV
jgi:hypothetical protein